MSRSEAQDRAQLAESPYDKVYAAIRDHAGGALWPRRLHDCTRAVLDALAADDERERGRPEIVCICGSSRFIDQIAVVAWTLEKEGAIALGMHLLPQWYEGVQADHQAEAEGIAEQMDALHLRKIEMADRVFVVNPGGYVGESTRREIEYATKLGKPIGYAEDPPTAPEPRAEASQISVCSIHNVEYIDGCPRCAEEGRRVLTQKQAQTPKVRSHD